MTDRRFPSGILLASVSLLLACSVLFADAVAYSRIFDVRAESAKVIAEHHHDWSKATREARRKMISTTKDPFTSENTYAFLRLRDKDTGKERFRKPVPALTHLWISPDSRYVVGLSDIKLDNPYQLVVFYSTGRRLFAKNLTGVSWPSVSQSVTNAILWYKEPKPVIRLKENQGSVILSIEDRGGTMREFRFPAAQ